GRAAQPARDDGDELAALVRRAQRLQDRGDSAGALRTLAQAEEALQGWKAHLRRDQAKPDQPGAGATTPGSGSGSRPGQPGQPGSATTQPRGGRGGFGGGGFGGSGGGFG